MKFIDWFAGVGGFRKGMEETGHECVGFCEFDKYAVMSYTAMHLCTSEQLEYLETLPLKERQKEILKEEYRNGEWFANDVRSVDARSIPDSDCWCFGFPCQDILIGNSNANGFQGNRSSLFFRVMYLVRQLEEEKRPTYLFIENVKNLLSVNGGWDFARLLIEMDRCGYDAQWQVINSKHHGVAQNRERCFVVGCIRKSGQKRIFPIEKCTDGVLRTVQCDVNGKGNRSVEDRFYLPDGIMATLSKARAQSKAATIVDNKVHLLTARERMRLQGWTDDYIDRAYLVNTPIKIAEQAGNGVTVTVIEAIAKKMKGTINNE